jgi:hypothetical protein
LTQDDLNFSYAEDIQQDGSIQISPTGGSLEKKGNH